MTAPRPARLTAPRAPVRLLLAVAAALAVARFAATAYGALDVFADYHAYYRAAANLRAGADLYAEGLLLVARNSHDFWTQTDGQYVYPPALAVALLPLTVVDIGKGGPIWLLALVLATLGFIWLAARLLGRPVPPALLLAVALPVAGALPLALGLRYGLVARYPLGLAAVALGAHLAFVRALRWPPRRDALPAASAAGALLLLALLALGGGLRGGQIDRFLLALALPGLLGTVALAWVRAARRSRRPPAWARGDLRGGLAAVTPVALPVLGALPLLLGLRFGQVDILLLGLTSASLLAHQRRRDLLAGVALGLAAAVKPTLALYGLYYLRKRRWATLGAATLTGALAGLAPFALLGGGALADWLAISRYFGGGDYLAYPNNQSLRGFLLRAFAGGPEQPPLAALPPLALALWLVGAGAAALGWWRLVPGERAAGTRAVIEWSLTTALILLAAPLSEDIHYVGLLLPLALLGDRIARRETGGRRRAWALLACLAFIVPLGDLALTIAHGTLPRLLASSAYLWGLLLVGGLLIALCRDRNPTAPPHSYE